MYGYVQSRSLPIKIVADQYVSLFGGWSEELRKNELGLNMSNLTNTDIHPYTTRVMLRKFESRSRLPLFFKKLFEVIPLGKETPDAYSKSPKGEVVLPESELDSKEYSGLKRGDVLVMNNVIGKRLGDPMGLDSKVLEKILPDQLFVRYRSGP